MCQTWHPFNIRARMWHQIQVSVSKHDTWSIQHNHNHTHMYILIIIQSSFDHDIHLLIRSHFIRFDQQCSNLIHAWITMKQFTNIYYANKKSTYLLLRNQAWITKTLEFFVFEFFPLVLGIKITTSCKDQLVKVYLPGL